MRKFLLPIHLFFAFVATACLLLSMSGISYFHLAIYIPLVLIVILDVLLTLYDLITRKQSVLNQDLHHGIHIGYYVYITLVYIRFFFDQGMLYVNGDLMSRFTFIDPQLIYFLIGGVALTLFHIFTEVEEPKKQRKSRKK